MTINHHNIIIIIINNNGVGARGWKIDSGDFD